MARGGCHLRVRMCSMAKLEKTDNQGRSWAVRQGTIRRVPSDDPDETFKGRMERGDNATGQMLGRTSRIELGMNEYARGGFPCETAGSCRHVGGVGGSGGLSGACLPRRSGVSCTRSIEPQACTFCFYVCAVPAVPRTGAPPHLECRSCLVRSSIG